jgi:siderophore synthetase component
MTDPRNRAQQTVRGKLAAALRREGLTPADVTPALEAELRDAEEKLALAYERRLEADLSSREPALSHSVVRLEQLATEGHNLHPCGRTRLGWTIGDAMRHDLESPGTTVRWVGVPRERFVGDDLGERLAVAAPHGYRAQPVHEWQLGVIRERYPDLPVLDEAWDARVTAAVRTLWVPERDVFLKLSLDVQITSTRRTISIASTRNGPQLSALLPDLLAQCSSTVELLREPAGAAATLGSGRDLSAIVRDPLPALASGEVAVPAIALTAIDPYAGVTLIDQLVELDGRGREAFLDDYARLLLTPALGMATRFGVGLEAHLQNCIVTFTDGRPTRLILRDLAGLRLHAGRMADASIDLDLWPGSVVGTPDDFVLMAKVAYTALQAHLGEVVAALGQPWSRVRAIVDEIYAELAAHAPVAAKADHAFLTAPTVPHKALVRMRLADRGDIYVPMENPLHEPS